MTFISHCDHLLKHGHQRSRPERFLHTYSVMVGCCVIMLLEAFDRFAELAQLGDQCNLGTLDRSPVEEDKVIQVGPVSVPPRAHVRESGLQSIYNA
jgi:hypothetical protein